MTVPSVDAVDLWVRYRRRPTPALAGVTFRAQPGECVALLGPSGAGKSTLFAVLSGLRAPSRGRVRIAGTDLHGIGVRDLRRVWRGVGLVTQRGDLVPNATVLMNVAIALPAAPPRTRTAAAMAALERLGIDDVAHARVDEVSGGQRQRAATARVLLRRPALVLADEPTAAVDRRSAALVLDALTELTAEGSTLIVATHDLGFLARADRSLALGAGAMRFDRSAQRTDDRALEELYDVVGMARC